MKQLFNSLPELSALHDQDEVLKFAELTAAVQQLKFGKVPEADRIPPDLLKHGG